MSIETLTHLTAPTIAVTGGTTMTFAPDGTNVNRGFCVSNQNATDIRERQQCVFKNQSGTIQADGTWSKNRRSVKFVEPGLTSDGKQDFPFFEISLCINPLWDAAKIASMKEKAAQLIVDSDVANFWLTGSMK
jgi:hypothetical protein